MHDDEGGEDQASAQESGRRGGLARAGKLTAGRRAEIARSAARARWTSLPRATHTGPWRVDGMEIPCAVLDDGTRLLTQEGFLTAIGRAGKAKGGEGAATAGVDRMPAFLAAGNLKPFISEQLIESTRPIQFLLPSGVRAFGYRAELLADVCWVFINAQLEGKLVAKQEHVAERCKMLARAFGKVGIIALVDEATGYQADRERDELQRILDQYIVEEMRPWVRTFPAEFFKQVYRLHGWVYRAGDTKTPRYVGKFIDRYIYKPLPPGVRDELRNRNPIVNGRRKHKHFMFLTEDTGMPHLEEQVRVVTVLMKGADNKPAYERAFRRVFPGPAELQQPELPGMDAGSGADEEDDL